MIVYGYTNELEIVPVDLSAQEIVALGINRWRLDLLDPNPVTIRQDGQAISFSRLKNLVTSYRHRDDEEVRLCLYDEHGRPLCLSGKMPEPITAEPRWVVDVKPGSFEPQEHLLAYVNMMERCRTNDEPLWLQIQWHGGSRQLAHFPRDPDWLHLTGNELNISGFHFRANESDLDIRGRMFEMATAKVELPAAITWVLDAFEGLDPAVFGPTVRELLMGKESECIELVVDTSSSSRSLFESLCARFGDAIQERGPVSSVRLRNCPLQFRYNGWAYLVRYGTPNSTAYAHSVNQFHISSDLAVHARRISWLDLESRRTRITRRLSISPDLETSLLAEAGFRHVPACMLNPSDD